MTAECVRAGVSDYSGGADESRAVAEQVDAAPRAGASAADERHQVAVAAAMGLACAVGVVVAMLVGLLMTVGAVEVEAETAAAPAAVASAD